MYLQESVIYSAIYCTTNHTQQHLRQSRANCLVKMTSDLEMYGIAVAQSRGIASLLVTYFISPTPWPGLRAPLFQSSSLPSHLRPAFPPSPVPKVQVYGNFSIYTKKSVLLLMN